MYKKYLTKEQALQKLKHYCAYQERCHSEVKEKLFSLGIWKKDHDEIVATLIEESYLNEERFAIAFASGRFQIKQWGRVKIKYELKQKQVSEYSIKKALKQDELKNKKEVLFARISAYESLFDFDTAYKYTKAYVKAYPKDAQGKKELTFLETR